MPPKVRLVMIVKYADLLAASPCQKRGYDANPVAGTTLYLPIFTRMKCDF